MSEIYRRRQPPNFGIEKAAYDLIAMARIADNQMCRILARSGAIGQQHVSAIWRLIHHLRDMTEDLQRKF